MEKKKFKVNIHIVFGVVAVLIIVILAVKILGFGKKITKEEVDAQTSPENAEIQSNDYFIPVIVEDDGTFPAPDGKTTVVCLGNAPFADDRESANNVCNLFEKNTGATVYNCSIPGSYMSSLSEPLNTEANPMDAFSFYHLVSMFTSGNSDLATSAYASMENVPKEIKDSVNTLTSLDFKTVDTIFILYDASDYLDNHKVYTSGEYNTLITSTAYDYYIDSMVAGVNLIKEKYPWIRIIVMSHPYAYAVKEDGSYVSSDATLNTWGVPQSTYFDMQTSITYQLEVSFVDDLYGGIHEEIAKDYLKDNLHLNKEGQKLIADRMKEAQERYPAE